MDFEKVSKMCKKLGRVSIFNENVDCFGNMVLEITTSRKMKLLIVSDRGEYSCYVQRKHFLRSHTTLIHYINGAENASPETMLEQMIEYLQTNFHSN